MTFLEELIAEEERSGAMVRRPSDVQAYGTSEGVKKEWDERGRSEKKTFAGWIRTYKTEHGDVEVKKHKPVTRGQSSAFIVHHPDGTEKRFVIGVGPGVSDKVNSYVKKHFGIEDGDVTRTVRDIPNNVEAYGTSEGVRKEWDERGRGRAKPVPKTIAGTNGGWLRSDGKWVELGDQSHGVRAVMSGLADQVDLDDEPGIIDEESTMQKAIDNGHVRVTTWEPRLYNIDGNRESASKMEMLLDHLPKGSKVTVSIGDINSKRALSLDDARDFVKAPRKFQLAAYGTSEGVRKEWDERGRGQHPDLSNLTKPDLKEPDFKPKFSTASAGVLMVEPDGRVWVVEPKNHFGGYNHTFPKGTMDKDETPQQTAVREAYEESGLHGKIDDYLGDFQRSTSTARYYIGHRVGGDPKDAGGETSSVKLVDLKDPKLDRMLQDKWGDETADHEVLAALRDKLGIDKPQVDYLAEKLGEQKGSNPGGTYRGNDGVDRYIKFYSNMAQGRGEALANTLYRDLGVMAPKSSVIDVKGKQAFASEIMPGGKTLQQVGITPEIAKKVMEGFAADVLTANWDVVGLVNDNILTDGKHVARVDNGASFLYRAQGGLKPEKLLNNASEFHGFFSPQINKEYASLAKVAGYSSAKDMGDDLRDQVKDIVRLRNHYNGWDGYVGSKAPYLESGEREKIVGMLDARTKFLQEQTGVPDHSKPNNKFILQAEGEYRKLPLWDIQAYGTSEGVKKEWDTRGRGRSRPSEPTKDLQSEDGYLYHATTAGRLQDIAESGKLHTHGPSFGTDQSSWPDGSHDKRSYFSRNAGEVWQFTPEDGPGAVVRTKDGSDFRNESTGDVYTKKHIPTDRLEYLGDDKGWHSVKELTLTTEMMAHDDPSIDEKDEAINAYTGTRKTGYSDGSDGPYRCDHCIHGEGIKVDGKDKSGCDNTHVLKDTAMESVTIDGKHFKIIKPEGCCWYYRSKDAPVPESAKLDAAAELPDIEGFDDKVAQEIREYLIGFPRKLLHHTKKVVASPELNAVHGRYDPETETVQINPANFHNGLKFGTHDPADIDEHVLAHELCHGLWDSMDESEQAKWMKLSGWMKGTQPGQALPYIEKRPGWPHDVSMWTYSKDAKFARKYQQKNPNEDFADCCAYCCTGNGDDVPKEKREFIEERLK